MFSKSGDHRSLTALAARGSDLHLVDVAAILGEQAYGRKNCRAMTR